MTKHYGAAFGARGPSPRRARSVAPSLEMEEWWRVGCLALLDLEVRQHAQMLRTGDGASVYDGRVWC